MEEIHIGHWDQLNMDELSEVHCSIEPRPE